jgi:predicted membrane channel-forming protein YqfA (hemolysin III family)
MGIVQKSHYSHTILGSPDLWNSPNFTLLCFCCISYNLFVWQEQVAQFKKFESQLSHPYMNRIRDILHRGDRAMIYIFIAASYFPWLTLVPNVHEESKSSSSILPTVLSWLGVSSIVAADLRWTVWFLAAMGILYQHIFHEKYKWLETLFYIAIGLIPALPFLHKVIFCKIIFHWVQFRRFS